VQRASAVVVGSNYLAGWIEAHLGRSSSVVIPSSVDAAEYPSAKRHVDRAPITVGWIGSPGNLRDLDVVRTALRDLVAEDSIVFRVVSSEAPELGFATELRPWSRGREQADLLDLDVGIMPLHDDEAARGRCGFKAIQYMAAGLPVVASPVGGGSEVIEEGRTGYYAADEPTWRDRLRELTDPNRRTRLGEGGRERVSRNYTLDVVSDRWLDVLAEVAAGVATGHGS
jgi:glycosyltransferase involved in cell wall biosynthesis